MVIKIGFYLHVSAWCVHVLTPEPPPVSFRYVSVESYKKYQMFTGLSKKKKCRLIMPDFSSRDATEIAVGLGGLSTTNDRPSKHGLGRYTSLSFSNRDSVGLVHFFSKPVRVELNRGPVCSVRLPCTLPRFLYRFISKNVSVQFDCVRPYEFQAPATVFFGTFAE